MIDMHYDLLSVLYQCYLRDDFSYIEKLNFIFENKNVSGLIANLYFMNPEEMKKEIGTDKIDVLEMFRISTELCKKYFPTMDIVFSIEGCDYIKSTKELEKLYELGLRSILLVWNNPNQYGCGNRENYGLTPLGKEFIVKAIDLGITIDLSHMNEKTFYDTLSLLKEQRKLGKKAKVIVSHSNCYDIYNHERNLTDDQIRSILEFDPVMGIVAYSRFIGEEGCDYKQKYLDHIVHAVKLLGIDRVGVSTDDMDFGTYFFNDPTDSKVFNYGRIKEELIKLLKLKFTDKEIEKIIYKNIYQKLFRRVL